MINNGSAENAAGLSDADASAAIEFLKQMLSYFDVSIPVGQRAQLVSTVIPEARAFLDGLKTVAA